MSFALRITIGALMLTVAAATAGLHAQESSQGQVSVSGCLQQTGDAFVLVVSESQRHQVQAAGPSVELAAHVNQQVELTGTVEKADETTIIKATALKMIANSCTP